MPYLPEGWTEASPGGLATNPHPLSGGIVDCAIATRDWFVIFNRSDLPTTEGFKSRDEAFHALEARLKQGTGDELNGMDVTDVTNPAEVDTLLAAAEALSAR